MWSFFKSKRIYLDHAAATPLSAEAQVVFSRLQQQIYANPSAIHHEGHIARNIIDEARLRIARAIKVQTKDVTFTSGGTESNALALFGYTTALHEAGTAYGDMEIIAMPTEHPSVLRALEVLSARGVVVKYAPVDESGLIVTSAFEELLSPQTRLVTVAYVNSETGVVQNLGKLSRSLKAYEKKHTTQIVLHSDASQAPLWLSCEIERLGADMLTLDAGKFGGPKGIGMLVHRQVPLTPILSGGSQEAGLRAGTENTAAVAAMAEAFVEAQAHYQYRVARIARLRDQLIQALLRLPGVVLNGSHEARVANNVNVSVVGIDAEFLVVQLDAAGIAVSTKSACSGADGSGSAVIRAMTGDEARAASTLRITLGPTTTQAEVAKATAVIATTIQQQQAFRKTLQAKH